MKELSLKDKITIVVALVSATLLVGISAATDNTLVSECNVTTHC